MFELFVNSNDTTSSPQFAVTAPASATCRAGVVGYNPSNATADSSTSSTCGGTLNTDNAYGLSGDSVVRVAGTVRNSTNAGTVQLQYTTGNNNGTMYAGSSLLAFKTVGSDVAEVYNSKQNLIPGTVVSLDPTIPEGVRASSGAYDSHLMGVISTAPGLILGLPQTSTGAAVFLALVGRVPVLVSTENGAIHAGDYLTSSSVAGVAMKATKKGMVIGQAMQDFSGSGVGVVMTFIKNTQMDALDRETTTGSDLAVKDLTVSGALVVNGGVTIKTAGADALTVMNGTQNVLRVDGSGSVWSSGTFHSVGADYAEWFKTSDADLMPGEAVCLDVSKEQTVQRCDRDGDVNVMGIVSSHPAFIGNQLSGALGVTPPGYVLVGLIGQVPARAVVSGSGDVIRAGDSLTPGVVAGTVRKARAGEATVGVALQGLAQGQGVINVLIARRNGSLTVESVGEKVLQTIADMKMGDEVQLMVAGALKDLDVDERIAGEVQKQVSEIPLKDQVAVEVAKQLSALKEELINVITSQQQVSAPATYSGSTTNYQLPTTNVSADTLTLTQTLSVGGNATLQGTLNIDGALIMNDLSLAHGLTVQGNAYMKHTLTADTLTSSSGAVINGTLRMQGSITLGTGALLFGSGTVNLDHLIIGSALQVLGSVTVEGISRFLGGMTINGELQVSGKQAGFAEIAAGETSVTVLFSALFTSTPMLSLSPNVPVLYAASPATQTGFVIRIASPAEQPIIFNWIALGMDAPLPGFDDPSNLSSDFYNSSEPMHGAATGATIQSTLDGAPLINSNPQVSSSSESSSASSITDATSSDSSSVSSITDGASSDSSSPDTAATLDGDATVQSSSDVSSDISSSGVENTAATLDNAPTVESVPQ
jgi:hypothetical protein